MTTELEWEIPAPLSACDVRLEDGTFTTLRRHGNPDGPRLVLSHGNGLAIDLYFPFWSRLAADFDLIVHDLRNHGWNAVGGLRNHDVPTMVRDGKLVLEAIDLHYGSKPRVGVFHSVSALIALLSSSSAAGRPDSTRRCPYLAQVLFAPPLCTPGPSQATFEAGAERAAAAIRQRNFRFETREEYVALLRNVPTFARCLPGVLDLMARTTLREPAGGWGHELCCPREYEARIMDDVRRLSPHVDLPAVGCPTMVIGPDPAMPYTYFPPFNLAATGAVEFGFIPDTTHFVQLEKPEECVASMREFLERRRLS